MAAKITKSYIAEVHRHKETQKHLKDLQLDYKVLEERYNAVEQTNQELEQKLKLYQKGGVMYTLYPDTDYVSNVVEFPNDHETTLALEQIGVYTIKELHDIMRTKLYINNPFIKKENGILIIDNEQLKKYKGAILL